MMKKSRIITILLPLATVAMLSIGFSSWIIGASDGPLDLNSTVGKLEEPQPAGNPYIKYAGSMGLDENGQEINIDKKADPVYRIDKQGNNQYLDCYFPFLISKETLDYPTNTTQDAYVKFPKDVFTILEANHPEGSAATRVTLKLTDAGINLFDKTKQKFFDIGINYRNSNGSVQTLSLSNNTIVVDALTGTNEIFFTASSIKKDKYVDFSWDRLLGAKGRIYGHILLPTYVDLGDNNSNFNYGGYQQSGYDPSSYIYICDSNGNNYKKTGDLTFNYSFNQIPGLTFKAIIQSTNTSYSDFMKDSKIIKDSAKKYYYYYKFGRDGTHQIPSDANIYDTVTISNEFSTQKVYSTPQAGITINFDVKADKSKGNLTYFDTFFCNSGITKIFSSIYLYDESKLYFDTNYSKLIYDKKYYLTNSDGSLNTINGGIEYVSGSEKFSLYIQMYESFKKQFRKCTFYDDVHFVKNDSPVKRGYLFYLQIKILKNSTSSANLTLKSMFIDAGGRLLDDNGTIFSLKYKDEFNKN